ncbi:DUF599 domain-containing protein [Falsirhodobacter algicola]|uniref:DUF599 family protein n=1 Tax=Falsirhodobacter algicola TaxID=2692330 RepID=A0A8J8SLK4_9RHOB|nr:DUF599 domain-containing protein [Falsirhodobacter algicola]QUS36628.1 DUF599 family protein [Falsirhodobacter algicola]
MELLPRLSALGWPDAVAVTLIVTLFWGIGYLVEHPPRSRPSMSILMANYRRDWMTHFVTRQQKILDGTVITSLRQATSFFISGTMLALGAGLALVGNPERLILVANDLNLRAQAVVVEVKVIFVLLFLANAFLKFIWSHRLFGYCAVLMGSVPNDEQTLAYHRAAQAAELNVTAARSYNRGLRSVYFALAALGWLMGPWTLMLSSVITAATLVRREFASRSREVVMRRDP